MTKTQIIGQELQAVKKLLKQAFSSLRKNKIAARMNFLCCCSCGGSVLSDIIKENKLDGYVFYHHQNKDSLQEDGDVYLHFSGCDDSTEKTAAIGRKVDEILNEVGLPTKWDGTSNTCILVEGSEFLVQWRKDEEHRQKIEKMERVIRITNSNISNLEDDLAAEKKVAILLEKQFEELKNESR